MRPKSGTLSRRLDRVSSYPLGVSKEARYLGASGSHLGTGREKTAMGDRVSTVEAKMRGAGSPQPGCGVGPCWKCNSP